MNSNILSLFMLVALLQVNPMNFGCRLNVSIPLQYDKDITKYQLILDNSKIKNLPSTTTWISLDYDNFDLCSIKNVKVKAIKKDGTFKYINNIEYTIDKRSGKVIKKMKVNMK